MEAIKSHEGLDDIAFPLSSLDWCELGLLQTILDPSLYVHKKLESNKVTSS